MKKNPAAVALGKRRMETMSKAEKTAFARAAANARWAGKRKESK